MKYIIKQTSVRNIINFYIHVSKKYKHTFPRN